MGVKIKKRGSKWCVYVNYHGKRKNRCVGTCEAAEKVRRELQARLALGDVTFLSESKTQAPSFKTYAEQWLTSYAETECKPSTRRSYEQLLRVHATPRFGSKLLTEIRRDDVKRFLADVAQVTRDVKGQQVPKFSKNTLRLIVCKPARNAT